LKIVEGKEAVARIEKHLVFADAALDLAIVPGSIGLDESNCDAELGGS